MRVDELKRLKESLERDIGVFNEHKKRNFAVLVSLVLVDEEFYFLFQKRAKGIRQGGEISFCGGGVDEGESAKEAVLREAFEEIGVKKDKIEIVGQLDRLVHAGHVLIDSFVAILHIDSLNELDINRCEVDEVFMLPISFFNERNLNHYQTRTIIQPFFEKDGETIELFPTKKHNLPNIYHREWGETFNDIFLYESQHGTIWGLTSILIHEVLRLLRVDREI